MYVHRRKYSGNAKAKEYQMHKAPRISPKLRGKAVLEENAGVGSDELVHSRAAASGRQ